MGKHEMCPQNHDNELQFVKLANKNVRNEPALKRTILCQGGRDGAVGTSAPARVKELWPEIVRNTILFSGFDKILEGQARGHIPSKHWAGRVGGQSRRQLAYWCQLEKRFMARTFRSRKVGCRNCEFVVVVVEEAVYHVGLSADDVHFLIPADGTGDINIQMSLASSGRAIHKCFDSHSPTHNEITKCD